MNKTKILVTDLASETYALNALARYSGFGPEIQVKVCRFQFVGPHGEITIAKWADERTESFYLLAPRKAFLPLGTEIWQHGRLALYELKKIEPQWVCSNLDSHDECYLSCLVGNRLDLSGRSVFPTVPHMDIYRGSLE